MNLLILVYDFVQMKMILYIRCYRYDPDPVKKGPDPVGQKSTDPTGSESLSLATCNNLNPILFLGQLVSFVVIMGIILYYMSKESCPFLSLYKNGQDFLDMQYFLGRYSEM